MAVQTAQQTPTSQAMQSTGDPAAGQLQMDTRMGMNTQRTAQSQPAQMAQSSSPTWGQTWGNNQSQGSGSQPLDIWAISSGQQQYGAPPPNPNSPYEQPGGWGGGNQGGGLAQPAPWRNPEIAQTGPQQAGMGPGMDLATWMGLNNDGGQRRSLAEYSQLMQPYLDRTQNAYQYGMDFNEQSRRWDTQQQWAQTTDTANIELAYRQQGLSEEQARIAAQQWDQQFGHTVANDQFNQGLATRDQDLAELQNTQQYGLSQRGMSLQELQNSQRHGLDTRAADLAEQTQAQQYGLDLRRQDDLMTWNNMQDRLARDQMGQQGQLTREQMAQTGALTREGFAQQRYEADLQSQLGYAGLGQQKYSTDIQAAIQRQQMMQQYGIDTRGLDLQQQSQLANQLFQREQLGQQSVLQREQMALQERLGTMQAYGRAQAPQAKFQRDW